MALVVMAIRAMRASIHLLMHGVPTLARVTHWERYYGWFLGWPISRIKYSFTTQSGHVVHADRRPPEFLADAIEQSICQRSRVLVVYDPVNPDRHEIDSYDVRQVDRLRLLESDAHEFAFGTHKGAK